jgi:hypothetical protein
MMYELNVFVIGGLSIVATLGAWITHVVTCIQTESWIFLLAGAICFPVGIIHGWMIWLGFA